MPMMIDRGAVRTTGGRHVRFRDDDEDTRQLEQIKSARLIRHGAEDVDPGLLRRVGIGNHKMNVSERNTGIVRGRELREKDGG